MNLTTIHNAIKSWKIKPTKILMNYSDYLTIFENHIADEFICFEQMLIVYQIFKKYASVEICSMKDNRISISFINENIERQILYTNQYHLINAYREAIRLQDKNTMRTISAYLLGNHENRNT